MSRIVELRDQRPLVVRKSDIPGDGIRICRCGLSAAWPFCGDSHKATRAEAKGKVYRYVRDVPEGTLRRIEVDLGDDGERPSRQGTADAERDLI